MVKAYGSLGIGRQQGKQTPVVGAWLRALIWLVFGLGIGLGQGTPFLHAQSDLLRWGHDLPIMQDINSRAHKYRLEIASDDDFKNILVTKEVDRVPFEQEAHGDFVWHWRLVRLASSQTIVDKKTHTTTSLDSVVAAGSLVSLQPITGRDSNGDRNLAKSETIIWQPHPKATSYTVKVAAFYGAGEDRVEDSFQVAGRFFLARRHEQVRLLISIYPNWKDYQIFEGYRITNGLEIERKPKAEELAEAMGSHDLASQIGNLQTEQSQDAAGDSQPTQEPVAPVDGPVSGPVSESGNQFPTKGNIGFSLGVAWGSSVFRKLDLEYKNESQNFAMGYQLRVNPAYGLIVGANGIYYDEQLRVEDQNLSAEVDEKTISFFFLKFRLGWNLLHKASNRHQLILGLDAGVSQFPTMPLEYDPFGGALPDINHTRKPLLGGGVGYWAFMEHFFLGASGSYLVDEKKDTMATLLSLQIGILLARNLSIEIKAENRMIGYSECSDDTVICLRDGKSNTEIQSSDIGIGLSWFY